MKRLFNIMAAMLLLASCGQKQNNSVEVFWMPDREPSNNPVALFGDVPQEIVDELGIQDGIPASMSAVLVKVGGIPYLFDAGLGSPDSRLIPTLKENGVDPASIENIFITHLHGDHIGGLANPDTFPNAKLWMSNAEYEGWKNMEGGNDQQLKLFENYKDRICLFNDGDTMPGGFKAMVAAGHTPGHTVYTIGEYIIIGDLMHGAALQMAYPEYSARYDQNPEQAVASRKQFLQFAKDNGLKLVGMHLPGILPAE